MTGTYTTYAEIKTYFEAIGDYVDVNGTDAGTAFINGIIRSVSGEMDSRLGVKYSVPIGTLDDGSYDPILGKICAHGCLSQVLERRHSGESDTLPPWIVKYGETYDNLLNGLAQGSLALKTETTRMELGVNPPITGTGNQGMGKFYTNSGLTPYGDVYQGQYPKMFWVQIDGTSGTNGVIDCTYKASADDGLTWFIQHQNCGTEWTSLQDGVFIRFEGTSIDALGTSGTLHQFELNDLWKFKCIPMEEKVEAGDQFALVDQFVRNG